MRRGLGCGGQVFVYRAEAACCPGFGGAPPDGLFPLGAQTLPWCHLRSPGTAPPGALDCSRSAFGVVCLRRGVQLWRFWWPGASILWLGENWDGLVKD